MKKKRHLNIVENGKQVRPRPEAPPPGNFLEQLERETGATAAEQQAATALEHVNREPSQPAEVLMHLSVDDIVVSGTNPRREFGDLKDLTASIEQHGVLQALLVRRVDIGAIGAHELVCGHRRLAAAKLAGLETVPCEVRDLTDVQVREAQLVENVQRVDISALEEADAYAELQRTAGYTGDQIALRVGKSRAWVYARLKLCALGPEGRRAVSDGRIHSSVAVPLARLPTHALQAKAVTHLTKGEKPMGAAEALAWLQKEFVRSLKACPFSTKDDMLVPEAGACTKCPKNSATGTPGLFEDLAAGAWCTDTKCFDAKALAQWEARAAKAKAKGLEVMSVAEGRKLFARGESLGYSSKYVVADEPIGEDSKKRTWAELREKLPEEKRPKLHLVPDAKLRGVEVLERDVALKAFADELDLSWAEARVEKVERQHKRTNPDEAKKEEEARAVREAIIDEVVAGAAAKVASTGLDLRALRQLAAAALHGGRNASPYFEALGVEKPEKWVAEKADAKALGAFVFWCFLGSYVGTAWSGYGDEFLSLAEAYEFDVAAMTSTRLAVEAVLEKPKAKRKGGAR